MFNNKALNSKIKKLLKDLKREKGISLYRVAKETSIPHSSMKYMLDNRFEWKLNHLHRLVTFLKKYMGNISFDDLLNDASLYKENTDDNLDQFYATSPNSINTFTVAPDPMVNYQYFSKEIGKKKSRDNSIESLEIKGFNESERKLIGEVYRLLNSSPVSKENKVSVNIKITRHDGSSPEEIKFTFKNEKRKIPE